VIKTKPLKDKKCKNKACARLFSPARPMQSVCGPRCGLTLARAAREKKERAEDAAKKKALRPRSEWLKLAQAAFNRYAKARDISAGYGCVSCGARPEQKFGGTMDCGHYRSTGAAAHLRFRLDNVAAQCVRCNRHLAGNAVEFRAGLVARRGVDRVEALEADNKPRHFDIDYLQRIRKVFAKKAKRLEKRMESRNV